MPPHPGPPGRYRFRFRTVWRLPQPPAAVYPVLARPEEYPRWWPQVREAVATGPDEGRLRVRAALPYEIRLHCRRARQDPAAGLLEVELAGDMAGRARWIVAAAPGGGTVVRYEQQVYVLRPLLRRLALPARPLLRANHALMMRAGRRGLLRWLEQGQERGLDDRRAAG